MGRRRKHKPATVVFGYPDIHWEIRDERALAVADAAHRYLQPDITVVGGDLLDCRAFARFPNARMVDAVTENWAEEELNPANEWLDGVQERTKRSTIFLEGNHEARVEIACSNGNAALRAAYDFISPRKNLSRGRKKFEYIPWIMPKKFGPHAGYAQLCPGLITVHGWAANRYAARRHLEMSRTNSIIFHHTHRADDVEIKDPWSNNTIRAMSAGCLCDLQPVYAHGGNPLDWCHGFWIAYISNNEPGNFTMYRVVINKYGAVLPDGKEIRI